VTNVPDTVHTLSIIQRFNDAFNRHAVDDIMALMTDDCLFEDTYPPPDGQRYHGQASVRARWEQLFAASPDARFEFEDIVACGDVGVVRWLYRWAADTADQPGHVRGVDVFRVSRGKIAEKRSYVKG
jgi:ketosteroid isomerase-like protein